MESQEKIGVGSLLKNEREEKGLSIDHLARITRLRRHYIEALEGETWRELPAPVYVKGFIRSYARGVGFDGREAIRLYESIAPVEEEIPRPLTVLRVPKRRPTLFIVSFVAVLAVLIYLLVDNRSQVFEGKGDIIVVQEEQVKETAPQVEEEQPQAESEQELSLFENKPERELPLEMEPQVFPEPMTLLNATQEEPDSIYQSEEPDSSLIPENASSQVIDELLLTGIINMRTYIKIYVDENLPKEYIFEPGARPQWTAKKGFDILIGNAAGVEFEFNGERINDLGELGKVVRVRLPEDFKSELYESIRDIN